MEIGEVRPPRCELEPILQKLFPSGPVLIEAGFGSNTTRTTMAYDLKTLMRILSGIDRLPVASTGAFDFIGENEAIGSILVEDSRVCWASAQRMTRRLSDILRVQRDPAVPESEISEVFRECQKRQRPLGEMLVSKGLIDEVGLSRGLRQQTAEAIAALTTESRLSAVWTENPRSKYDAKYTFSTSDLLVTIAAVGFEDLSREGEAQLKEFVPGREMGVAFVLDRAEPIPIACLRADSVSCDEFMDLGAWVFRVVSQGRGPVEGQTFVAKSNGFSWTANRRGPLVCVRLERRNQAHSLRELASFMQG